MTRIKGTNIHVGESFVVPIEKEESAEVLQLKEKLASVLAEIKNAEQKKQELIEEGQKQAEALINEAKEKIEAENKEIALKREEELKKFEDDIAKESEKIKAEAYQTGYDDGYKQGYVVITNELENKVLAVNDFAKSQFDLKNNIIKSSELDIINLVIEIAKKVCTKSIEIKPEILKQLTVNAIKELKDKEEITIIINPKLMEVINSVSDKLKEEIPNLQSIKILEDSSISADGTIVESLLTRVDCRVKSQINELADKLYEAYNSQNESVDEILMSLENNEISNFENIELSDDANIDAFLDELEDIPSYDYKIREEDALYYKNLDIEALKDPALEENNTETKEKKRDINDINVDEYEAMFEDDNEINVINEADLLLDKIENEPDSNVDIPSELNPDTFLDDDLLLPEIEEKNGHSPAKEEDITGEEDVQ